MIRFKLDIWTEQSRGWIAMIAKKSKRCLSDLTEQEWEEIAPLMPPASKRGQPRVVDSREITNALRCLVRSGCGWEMLSVHFGPWEIVCWWARQRMRRF